MWWRRGILPHYHGTCKIDRLAVTPIIAEMARIVNDGFLRAVFGITTGEILLNVKMQGNGTVLPAIFA